MFKKYGHRETRCDELRNFEFIWEEFLRWWLKPTPLKTKIWLRIIYKYDYISYVIRKPFIMRRFKK